MKHLKDVPPFLRLPSATIKMTTEEMSKIYRERKPRVEVLL